MKTKHYLIVCIALAAIYLSGCKKDLHTPATDLGKNVARTDSVLTPGGLMAKSQVFLIEPGYHISVADGRVLKVQNNTGKIMLELGKLNTPVNQAKWQPGLITASTRSNLSPGAPAITNTAWQAYSYWHNTSAQPISSFSTTWTVPPAPSTNTGSNQLIYIFNGTTRDDQSDILQPVLQWGYNRAFGGSYWSISNWYLWSGGAAYTTPVTSITPGTSLQGVITYTGLTGSSYNYTCAFTGYSSATMNVSQSNVYHSLSGGTVALPVIPLQTWAYEALESYHYTGTSFVSEVSTITDYPSIFDVRMTNISLLVNGSSPSPFSWTTGTGTASFGENTSVVNSGTSGSGEVDLYFSHTSSYTFGVETTNINPTWFNITVNGALFAASRETAPQNQVNNVNSLAKTISGSTVVMQITAGHIPTIAYLNGPFGTIYGTISGSNITFSGVNLSIGSSCGLIIN